MGESPMAEGVPSISWYNQSVLPSTPEMLSAITLAILHVIVDKNDRSYTGLKFFISLVFCKRGQSTVKFEFRQENCDVLNISSGNGANSKVSMSLTDHVGAGWC